MFSDFVNNLMPYISHFSEGVYLMAFFIAFLEAFIYTSFFIPGSTIIILISFFSVQNGIDIRGIFLSGFIGVLTGNLISYFIGLNYHKKNLEKVFKIIKLENIQKTKNVIENHAFKTLTIGRLIPVFKEIIFFLSGVNKMNFIKFLVYTIIGNFVWSFVFIGVPYIFSYSLSMAQLWIDKFTYFVILLFFLLGFLSYLRYLLGEYGRDILFYIFKIFSRVKLIIYRQKISIYLYHKYPRFFLFVSNRIKNNSLTGLPLTILFLLFLYFFLAFVGLIEDILKSESIIGLDIRLSAFFYAFRNDLLVQIFLWITSFGRDIIVTGFFILLTIYFYIYNKRNHFFAFSISFFGSVITGYFFKIFFHHNRPELAVYIEKGYSFPSLHAIISISFYGYIFWLILKSVKGLNKKLNYFFVFLIFVILLCFSRLYLGVHYLSDILGGLLIGFLWLFLGIGLTEYFDIKYNKNIGLKYKTNNKYFLIYLICISFFYFIFYNLLFPYNLISDNNKFYNVSDIKNLNSIFTVNSLKFSQNFMGKNAENINFVFLAKNDYDVDNIFKNAKWENADKINYSSIKSMAGNLIFQKSYETAPITPLFWDNKTQDFSFQKTIDNKNIRFRHHIRIWKTDYSFDGKFVYVGVGVYDDGLKWWYFTHKISPDINKEREYIFSDLLKTNLIEYYNKIEITDKYSGINVFGDKFFSDGSAYLIGIK